MFSGEMQPEKKKNCLPRDNQLMKVEEDKMGF